MKDSTKLLLILGILAISSQATAQVADAVLVRATIERHYAAINSGDVGTILSHHLPNMTHFNRYGRLLEEVGFTEAVKRQGATVDRGTMNMSINSFNAQIYGDVAVATFYLVGSYTLGEVTTNGAWRVSAVWVREGRTWKEAHHHESPLMAKSHP